MGLFLIPLMTKVFNRILCCFPPVRRQIGGETEGENEEGKGEKKASLRNSRDSLAVRSSGVSLPGQIGTQVSAPSQGQGWPSDKNPRWVRLDRIFTLVTSRDRIKCTIMIFTIAFYKYHHILMVLCQSNWTRKYKHNIPSHAQVSLCKWLEHVLPTIRNNLELRKSTESQRYFKTK